MSTQKQTPILTLGKGKIRKEEMRKKMRQMKEGRREANSQTSGHTL